MDFECKEILLSQIDRSDQTFRISTDESVEPLMESIQALGLLSPPILKPISTSANDDKRYVIVAGFRRINACHQLGWRRLTAICIQKDTLYYRCALAAISENFFKRKPNLVETARCIGLIEASGEKRREGYETLKAIGLQTNTAMIEKLKTVDTMDDRLKNGIAEGAIALPVALELCHSPDVQGARSVVELLLELRISLSRQREMLDWLQAIAHRDRVTLESILNDDAIQRYRHDATMDIPRKAKLIREHLRRRRYPEISAYEKHYADTVKLLPLEAPLQLIPPANFESPAYSLKINFSTVDDLKQAIEKAANLSESPSLKSLLSRARS